MADALNLDKFRRQAFVNPDLSLTRDAATEMSLLVLRTGGPLGEIIIPAQNVKFVPTGSFDPASINAQLALTELDAEKVPNTRTVNGKALSSDIILLPVDVGADPAGAATNAITVHVAHADPHPQYAMDTDLAGFVPTTRTINGKPLSANVTLTAADVGAGTGNGTVTTVSVASANGFGGSVANAGTTPAITLTTSLTGLLKGNGTAMQVAAAGTDYQAPLVSGTNIKTINGSSVLGSGNLVVGGGSGDVVGPASAVAGNLVLFDGATGKLVKDSGYVPGVGVETMLANVTLGVAGTSLSSGTFAACKFLRVEIYVSGYGSSDTASLQFNATAGTGYRYRWLTCAAGATVFAAGLLAASTDRIKIAGVNTARSRRVKCSISNDPSNTEKLVVFDGSVLGTISAATQADIALGNGAWISGAATSITRIDLITTGGANMNAGTQMTVFGWN